MLVPEEGSSLEQMAGVAGHTGVVEGSWPGDDLEEVGKPLMTDLALNENTQLR